MEQFLKNTFFRWVLYGVSAVAMLLLDPLSAYAPPALPGDPTGVPISGLEIASLVGLVASVYVLRKTRN